MNMETVLHNEIKNEFNELSKLEVGTEKYNSAVDGIAKLVDRAITIDKLNAEMDTKHDDREIDVEFRTRQMDEEKKDRRVRNGIAVAGIVIPTAVTIWGTLKTLKFEEVGTVTTNAGREFMKRIFSRK